MESNNSWESPSKLCYHFRSAKNEQRFVRGNDLFLEIQSQWKKDLLSGTNCSLHWYSQQTQVKTFSKSFFFICHLIKFLLLLHKNFGHLLHCTYFYWCNTTRALPFSFASLLLSSQNSANRPVFSSSIPFFLRFNGNSTWILSSPTIRYGNGVPFFIRLTHFLVRMSERVCEIKRVFDVFESSITLWFVCYIVSMISSSFIFLPRHQIKFRTPDWPTDLHNYRDKQHSNKTENRSNWLSAFVRSWTWSRLVY